MRFEKLKLSRFGHFTDFCLELGKHTLGEPDLHVLYGPNEAGKSTTLAAITDLLYGIKRQTPWNFLHANELLELGATLQQGEQRVDIKRFKNHWTNASNDRLERFPLDLQGLTRDDYARRFSFDEQTLQAGGEQILNSDGDVGQALFSASVGLANLKEQMDSALSDANTFWMPRKKANLQLTDLKKALVENKKRMDAVKLDTTRWKKRVTALEHATLRRDKHRQLRDELQKTIRQLEKRQSAQALAAHYRTLTAQKNALREESVVPMEHPRAADFLTGDAARQMLDTTRDLLEQCRIAQASRTELETQQQQLQAQLEAATPDERTRKLVQASERIKALSDERSAEYEWRQQQAQCQSVISQSGVELDAARERLALAQESSLESLLPGESLLGEVQALLDEEQSLSVAIQHAQAELDALEPMPAESPSADNDAHVLNKAPDIDIAGDVLRTIEQAGLSNQLATAQTALLDVQHTHQAKLAKASLSAEQLSQLTLPDASWINSKLTELNDWQNQLKQLNERLDTLYKEITDKQTRCKILTAEGALDPAALAAARESREAAWLAHSQAIDALKPHPELKNSALQFEKSLSHHDALLAQAASTVQASTELQLLQAQLLEQEKQHRNVCEKQLPRLQASLQHCIKQIEGGVADFYAATPIDPDLLRNRHTTVAQLLVDKEAVQTQALAIEKLKHKASDQSRKLLTVLQPLQSPAQHKALARLDLDDLITQARQILETLRAQLEEQRKAELALSALARAHDERGKQVNDARQALTSWQERWELATNNSLFSAMSLTKARDSMAWLARLAPLVTHHRDAQQELESLSARLTTRETAIAQLLDEFDEKSLADAVQHLVAATTQIQKHEAIQQQLKTLQAKLEEHSDNHRSSLKAIENLRQELGVDSDQSLLALLIRTEQHRALNDRSIETLTQLRDVSGADTREDDIERLCHEENAEALEQQLAELNVQFKDASNTYDDSSEVWTLAKRELDDMGDESEYSRLNLERQNLLLQIMDLARQCAIARTGQKVLNAAMATFRQAHQSVILTEAQQAFTTLTRGRYVQLLPRDDGNGNERLFVIDRNQHSRAVTELSTGTRYQLYPALRAAAHADYATQRPPLPFVADDIMESFDDERSAAAFTVLARMAEKGQVIYLTHHQHLIDLAKDVVGKDRVRIHHFQ